MRLVPSKTLEQQDIQALHRGRQRLVNHRTALVAQMRGLLLDRGVAFAKSVTRARRQIRLLLENGTSELGDLFRSMLSQLYTCFLALDQQIAWFDKEIAKIFRSSDTCRRLAKIRGVGPKTATAIVAAVGDGAESADGRHLAAWA
jgi:transposase